MTPLFVVSDLQRAIDFYVGRLGFVEPALHGDPPCFAMINRDGFDLMLSLQEAPGGVRPNGPTGTWDAYVSLADIAAEIEALESAGVVVDRGPTDAFYGMREIEVVDPDGYRICLAQDVSGEQLGGAQAWAGVLDLGPARLRLVLRVAPSQGGWIGRLDSPDQGAMAMPVDELRREDSTLRFAMRALDAVFEGVLSADGVELSGTWTQRDRSWPLVMRADR